LLRPCRRRSAAVRHRRRRRAVQRGPHFLPGPVRSGSGPLGGRASGPRQLHVHLGKRQRGHLVELRRRLLRRRRRGNPDCRGHRVASESEQPPGKRRRLQNPAGGEVPLAARVLWHPGHLSGSANRHRDTGEDRPAALRRPGIPDRPQLLMRGADQRAADEESLAFRFDRSARRREGRYFPPAALVDFSLQLASAHLPRDRPLAIVDPSCGAGAFLLSAHRLSPRARLFGLELSKAIAAECRRRVPAATVISADALRADLPRLLDQIPPGVFELWVGNPPYNGTSSLLQDARAYRAIRGLLPSSASTPPGTSLRDDFAFFLLLAAERLRNRDGALAFITSATLLDAYLYSQLRKAMLAARSLREVVVHDTPPVPA